MNQLIPPAIRDALRRRGISVRDDEGGGRDDLLIDLFLGRGLQLGVDLGRRAR